LRSLLRTGADDAALAERLLQAVGVKPEKHSIADADFTPGARPMHGIGG
jgi:molybdenum cofactor biosynthesis enzyme MoaA